MTYNPLTKQWVYLGSNNFGGYNVSTSPGWAGPTMVWTATLVSDGSTGKLTITKVQRHRNALRGGVTQQERQGQSKRQGHLQKVGLSASSLVASA